MELWIRTQSKQSLVKVNNISINVQDRNRYIIDSNDYILGRYKSYARALEVLDEIQNILHPKLIITPKEDIKNFNIEMRIVPQLEYDIQELSTYVYEMPKE